MLLALVLVLVSAPVAAAQYATPAATYYVNGVTGLDTNDGRGPEAGRAFKTVAKLQATLQAGQVGAISGGAAGQCDVPITYREKLTLSVAATVTGYGCKPLLDASDPISAGAWSKTAGRTNIYQATVTVDSGSGTGYLRLWENGRFLAEVATLDLLDATAGRFYVANNGSLTGTSQTVYVHATNSSNPGTSSSVYDVNARLYGVFGSTTVAVRVSNVWTRRQQSNNGSFDIGRGSFASDIRADEGTKHNALMHGQSYWRNVSMRDSYYNSQKIAFVLNDDTPSGWNATLENASYVETTGQAGVGFYGHTNSGGNYGTVTLKNCSTVGASTSVSGFAANHSIIDGGMFNESITLGSYESNVVRNATTGQISVAYAEPVELDNITVTGTFTNGAVRVANNLGTAGPLTITDSQFSNATAFDSAIYIGTGTTVPTFTMTGNTFLAPVVTNHVGGQGAANLPTTATINGNTYHYPVGGAYISYRGTFYNVSVLSPAGWTAWQALGFDATGSRVTP